MPPPSPPSSPPAPMTNMDEEQLMRQVLEDYDDARWQGLKLMMALPAFGDVAIPKLEMDVKEEVVEDPPITLWNPHLMGQWWMWLSTATEMADWVGIEPCAPIPPHTPKWSPPWEEVVHAPLSRQPPHTPSTHLYISPLYVGLTMDDEEEYDNA
ncbi:histone-lysine n-methyltransferase atxr3 [Hordeum vulgare]|nr:histone-lysine n-methyltransferase atxr3 [Hordeum vulgare]